MKIEVPESLITEKFLIGNDLVHLTDFKESFNELFMKKVYTDEEIAYCRSFNDPLLRFASTWAAKESVYKVLKQFSGDRIAFRKIEISRNKIGGIPSVKLPGHFMGSNISLSISHDGAYVWAVALLNMPAK